LSPIETPAARVSVLRGVGAGFALLRRRPLTAVVLAVLFGYAPSLVTLAAIHHFMGAGGGLGRSIGGAMRRFAVTEALALAVSGFGYLLQGAMAIVAEDEASSERTSLGEVLARLTGRAPTLYGLGVIISAAVAAGSLALIVPGVLVQLAWNVAAPVAALEGRGVLASLDRSAKLTRGHRWALFGLLVAFGLTAGTADGVARLAAGGSFFRVSATDPPLLTYFAAPAVGGLGAAILAAVVAAGYLGLATVTGGVAAGRVAATFD